MSSYQSRLTSVGRRSGADIYRSVMTGPVCRYHQCILRSAVRGQTLRSTTVGQLGEIHAVQGRNIHTSSRRFKALENWKRPSIEEMGAPRESWKHVFDRNQKRFNLQLAAGLVAFGVSTSAFLASVEMNPTPEYLKSVEYSTVLRPVDDPSAEDAKEDEASTPNGDNQQEPVGLVSSTVAADDDLEKAAEEEAAKKAAEEEAAKKAAEEEAAKKAAEEEAAKKAAEEEAAKKAAEEEAAKKAAEEEAAAKKAAEEEAAKKAAEEEAAKKAAEEEAAKKAAEEEAAKKAADEAAKKAAEEAAKKAAEEEAAKKAAEEEAAKKAAEEEAARKAAEEAAKKAAEEVARKASEEEAAKKAVEEEAAKKATETVTPLQATIAKGEEVIEELEKGIEVAAKVAVEVIDSASSVVDTIQKEVKSADQLATDVKGYQ